MLQASVFLQLKNVFILVDNLNKKEGNHYNGAIFCSLTVMCGDSITNINEQIIDVKRDVRAE